jgi:pimeloyl-ACP methyl ester carboxylesterase
MISRIFSCFSLLLLGLSWPEKCDTRQLPGLVRHDGGAVPLVVRLAPDPVRMEVLNQDQTPPMFVMKGSPRGPGKLVFLHGMCGHGLGYAQAFQFSAAKWGTLIAPQGDVLCGAGPWAQWSANLTALDERIDAAFRALGFAGHLDDITVLGYSQGATRAEGLVRKWPRKYTRLVLIGAPQAPTTHGLSLLRAAVTMAGQRDRQDLMKAGARSLSAIGVPSTYQMIPQATHGAMGPTPESTMGEALAWLYTHSREVPVQSR